MSADISIPKALTIAGSDSSGGAGIQADLKTFTVHGVYGASAITALTAQNTTGVLGIEVVPAEFVRLQIDAVMNDIGADAVKTGMLANAEIVAVVVEALRRHRVQRLVVDPVMVAQSGARLMDRAAVEAVIDALIPSALLVTPNIPEAEALLGSEIRCGGQMREAALAIRAMGASACLLKGGHLDGADAVDVLASADGVEEISTPRLPSRHTHGTGCQLAAAITANLARGFELRRAVHEAKRFITVAIAHGLALGHGDGPANPMAWKLSS